MYTFCKSQCVINVGSPYGLHGVPYIFHIYMVKCGWLGSKITMSLSFIIELVYVSLMSEPCK